MLSNIKYVLAMIFANKVNMCVPGEVAINEHTQNLLRINIF